MRRNSNSVRLAALFAVLLLAGCASSQKKPGNIEITYTISGVQAHEERPAGPGGHWDKFIPNAKANNKLNASVTADQTSAGTLVCQITYQDSSGTVWLVDQARDSKPGSVTCRSTPEAVQDSMEHLKPIGKAPPQQCGLEQGCPGPDSLNLNVTWLNR